MHSFFTLLGGTGGILLTLSGLPQAYQSWKDGHSRGMSAGTLWLWFIGVVCMLLYTLYFYPLDMVLIINYIGNILLVGVILKFKYLPRKKEEKPKTYWMSPKLARIILAVHSLDEEENSKK